MKLVKVLVGLGANVYISSDGVTPLKMAMEMSGRLEASTDSQDLTDPRGFEETVHPDLLNNSATTSPPRDTNDMVHALRSVGATTESYESAQSSRPSTNGEPAEGAASTSSQLNTNEVATIYKQLNDLVQVKKEVYLRNPCPSVAYEAMEALRRVEEYSREHGSRILCLDGGGVRGLVQIEMLRQIEQRTGKRITELFDWIVGTSTGGIIALTLVYGRSLSHHKYKH